tara:strand:+ start:71 stop:493 length:423 start_codon:yes stop_codon:yes gene_type:complete
MTGTYHYSSEDNTMNINVSPIFSDSLTDINRTLIQWEEHKLTSAEAQQRIFSILAAVMHRNNTPTIMTTTKDNQMQHLITTFITEYNDFTNEIFEDEHLIYPSISRYCDAHADVLKRNLELSTLYNHIKIAIINHITNKG